MESAHQWWLAWSVDWPTVVRKMTGWLVCAAVEMKTTQGSRQTFGEVERLGVVAACSWIRKREEESRGACGRERARGLCRVGLREEREGEELAGG